jgi:zinc/manganese transport system permease protein
MHGDAFLNVIEFPLLWRVLLNSGLIAAIAAWLGVQILSRGIVFLGLAVAQGAAAGVTMALWLGFYPLLGSLGFVLGTSTALGSPRFRMKEGHEEGQIAILYVVFLALGALFLALNPHGEGRMLQVFYGNVLTIDGGESAFLWIVAAVLIGFQGWHWKAFLWLATDPRTASAFGVPFRLYNLLFFLGLGVGLGLLLHMAGLVVPLALMIVPAYTAFHTVTGVRAVLIVSQLLAIVPTLLAVLAGIAFTPDYPLGSMIAIAALSGSVVFFVGYRLSHLRLGAAAQAAA